MFETTRLAPRFQAILGKRTRDGTLSLSDRQISAVFSGRHDDMPSTSDMSPNLVKTKECSWVVGRLGMAEIVPGENNDFGRKCSNLCRDAHLRIP